MTGRLWAFHSDYMISCYFYAAFSTPAFLALSLQTTRTEKHYKIRFLVLNDLYQKKIRNDYTDSPIILKI